MNTSKRCYDVSWMMCPSTTFPGKFYYFNVNSGEAVWSLNDVEMGISTRNCIQRVTDKWHSYPEPNTPPTEECINTTHNCQYTKFDYPQNNRQLVIEAKPLFGQAVFPNNAPNIIDPCMPNTTWAPVPMTPSRYMGMGPNSHMKPSGLIDPQTRLEKKSHESWLIGNKPSQFQRPQEAISHENLFKYNKTNPFQNTVTEHSQNHYEINSHHNLFSVNKPNPSFQKPQGGNNSYKSWIKPPHLLQKPNMKNENIFIVENLSKTPTNKFGFDDQNVVRQNNKQSISNVYRQKTQPEIFGQKYNNRATQQPSTSMEAPKINKTWIWPVNEIKTNATLFNTRTANGLRPNDDEMPKKNQFQQNEVEIWGSKTDSACFGKSNFSSQKRWHPIIGQRQISPKKQCQHIGQSEIQTEKYVSKSNRTLENPDDSAFFQMTYLSPQKRCILSPLKKIQRTCKFEISPKKTFQNAKHEIPQKLDDSACFDMSDLSPQLGSQAESYIAFKCNENQPASSSVNTSLSPRKRVLSITNNLAMEDVDLDQSDLRYVLAAKKRKQSYEKQNIGKKIKTNYSNYQEKKKEISPKKHVTFNMGDLNLIEDDLSAIENYDDVEDMNITVAEDLSINSLRNLAKPHSKTSPWYIVVHSEVLMEEFEFIEKFVQADERCILLVPVAVRREIESWCMGDCQGQRQVLRARHLARRLAAPPSHIAVQLCEGDTNPEMLVIDSVLNCCFQALKDNYHMVLITNDAEICDRAKSLDLHCFMLQEIKDHAAIEKPALSFAFRKINKENNTNENTETLVRVIENQLPNLSLEFENIPKSATDNAAEKIETFPVNCFRKRMFDDKQFGSQTNMFDAKISMDCEEDRDRTIIASKNITQLNRRSSLGYESEEPAMTTEIGCHIRKLNIKGTPKTGLAIDERKDEDNPRTKAHNPNTSNITDIKNYKALKFNDINSYTIDGHLKKLIVKNTVAEERIKTRLDEWICLFTQTMEETLSDVIQNHSSPICNNMPAPWMLAEATDCIRELYGDHTSVGIVVDKLATLLFENSCKKGYLKFSVKPYDFMRILACGFLLIQCLKNILPNVPSLLDAEDTLNQLLLDIPDPGSDPETPQLVHTPVQTREEFSEPLRDHKSNFVKNSSEIISYLKRHFEAWQAPDDQDLNPDCCKMQEKNQQVKKVVRTLGRHLKLLKLNNNKTFILKRSADSKQNEIDQTDVPAESNQKGIANGREGTATIKSPEILEKEDNVPVEKESGAKLLRKLALNTGLRKTKLKEINIEKREEDNKVLSAMIDEMISGDTVTNSDIKLKVPVHRIVNKEILDPTVKKKEPPVITNFDINNCTFKKPSQPEKTNVKDFDLNTSLNNHGSKVVRKIKDVSKEELKKSNEKLNGDKEYIDIADDHTTQHTVTNYNDVENNDATENDPYYQASIKNNDYSENSNDYEQNNDKDMEYSNDFYIEDDSAFEFEVHHSHFIAKTFLAELSVCFKNIYRFLESSVDLLRENYLQVDKRMLHDKASVTLTHMAGIIENLKCIIKRESSEGLKLMDLLIKAKATMSSDKRMMMYRQVVTACLEQAQVLESSLRMLADATYDDNATSFGTNRTCSNNLSL